MKRIVAFLMAGCFGSLAWAGAEGADPAAKPALDLAGVEIGMPLSKALDKLAAMHPLWAQGVARDRADLMKDCPLRYSGQTKEMLLAIVRDKPAATLVVSCSKSDSGAFSIAEMWLRVELGAEGSSNLPQSEAIRVALDRRHGDPQMWDVAYDGEFHQTWRIESGGMGAGQMLSAQLTDGADGLKSRLGMHLWAKEPSSNRGAQKPQGGHSVTGFDSPY